MTERELDEIAWRALTLLMASRNDLLSSDFQPYRHVKLGEYELHYDLSTGLTINQRGHVHGTIFRQNSHGGTEECKAIYLQPLLKQLRLSTVLDQLAEIKPDE